MCWWKSWSRIDSSRPGLVNECLDFFDHLSHETLLLGAELQIQNEGEEGEDEDGASIRAKVVTEAKYGTPSPNSPRPDPSNCQASSAHLPMGQGNVALDDIIDHNYAISPEWLVKAVFKHVGILNTIQHLIWVAYNTSSFRRLTLLASPTPILEI